MSDGALCEWLKLVAYANNEQLFGSDFLRDPDYPCDLFEKGSPRLNGVCCGDGHYLCKECENLSVTCVRCNARDNVDECECHDER